MQWGGASPYINPMQEVHSPRHFYGTPPGLVAGRLLRLRLHALWPQLRGQSVLGLGYALPFLRVWREEASRVVAAVPAQFGPSRWPYAAPSCAAMVEEEALPFPDLTFDRILLVHGLEGADNTRRLLREAWRVLKDDGRLLVVAPNRLGLWAHLESTPFGHGQPYSPGQLTRLLERHMFRVERRDAALIIPPFPWRPLLKGAWAWERTGRLLFPRFAGVTVVEAAKDMFAGLPVKEGKRRRVVVPEAV